jgi:hypothetical protein
MQWEVGGYPAFTDIAKAYTDSADAVLVLFSEEKPGSWESLETWRKLIPTGKLVLEIEVLSQNCLPSDHTSHVKVSPFDSISVHSCFNEVVKRAIEHGLNDADDILGFEDLKSRTQVRCLLL